MAFILFNLRFLAVLLVSDRRLGFDFISLTAASVVFIGLDVDATSLVASFSTSRILGFILKT
jgi:hypothetical protein